MIDTTNEGQVRHFCRCWGVTREDIEAAILAAGTTKIGPVHDWLCGPVFRLRCGFDF